MIYEVTGKVIENKVVREGVRESDGTAWKVSSVVLEEQINDNATAPIALTYFGVCEAQVGDTVTASFYINSREYNGKWYNDCKAREFKVTAKNGELF